GDAPRVMGAMQRAVGRTNLANSEIAAIIAAYNQTGDVDVRRAANLVGRMGGTLRATGEGVDAMAAFMAAAGEVQLRRPDQIARYAAARGVSMQRSAELLQIMAPALQGRSQREIARAVVGAAQV